MASRLDLEDRTRIYMCSLVLREEGVMLKRQAVAAAKSVVVLGLSRDQTDKLSTRGAWQVVCSGQLSALYPDGYAEAIEGDRVCIICVDITPHGEALYGIRIAAKQRLGYRHERAIFPCRAA